MNPPPPPPLHQTCKVLPTNCNFKYLFLSAKLYKGTFFNTLSVTIGTVDIMLTPPPLFFFSPDFTLRSITVLRENTKYIGIKPLPLFLFGKKMPKGGGELPWYQRYRVNILRCEFLFMNWKTRNKTWVFWFLFQNHTKVQKKRIFILFD